MLPQHEPHPGLLEFILVRRVASPVPGLRAALSWAGFSLLCLLDGVRGLLQTPLNISRGYLTLAHGRKRRVFHIKISSQIAPLASPGP